MEKIMLNNADGEATNARSTPLPAAHNSDGFGLANSTLITLRNSTVLNQDDCVAITSGTDYTIQKMICVGGHGLSIGSIGGKGDGDPSKNEVQNVVFEDSMLYNQQNGIRIKTNAGETGLVKK
jgi:polygalacturonase